MVKQFNGAISLDVRDSVPDWEAYLDERAPEGAPNVLVVLYDDTGCAALSPYGGRVRMPTMDRLAQNGLTYTQWHTTALCSPTRSAFLTGRNHHQNGFASVADYATGFPGYHSHLPPECAPMAKVLRDAGWSTFWVGKNHNVPIASWTMGSSKKLWPLGMGYDRFYGFIGGETNQWFPNLAEDNHYIDQPYGPEDGYHLSKDLADKALEFIRDTKQAEPDKPWYMWFCPGATHAPHHAPQEYIDKYSGVFDDGYEAYREWVMQRMIEKGLLPEDTELTEINPMAPGTFPENNLVRPWDDLSEEERRLFARMAEVYAAFAEYTDVQIGRIVDYLEETGELDNTLIVYAADNGASAEGTPDGSVNENKFFNGWPDSVEENLHHIDELGGPNTYNHHPTGWAAAFSTPYRMFKRYSYQGGVCDPLVIHWPAGMRSRGELRHQYHHCTDIVPTILDCCGVTMPDTVEGAEQKPLPGVSMRYSFDDAGAPTHKETQYYEMLGTRAIWHRGWKAVAEHGPLPLDRGRFDQDRWQLFHTDVDRSEARDLAEEHPEKLAELKALWLEEAKKNDVLPLNDLGLIEVEKLRYRAPVPEDGRYVYYPGTSRLPEVAAPNTRGVSFDISAEVELTSEARGVVCAQGSRFGGFSLFAENGELVFVYNFLGIPPEQRIATPLPEPGRHVVGVEFTKERTGEHHESHGSLKLRVDGRVVAETTIRTQPGVFSIGGEGLCIGYDDGDAVSAEYRPRFDFEGGDIVKVVFTIADDAQVDTERELSVAMARD